MTRIVGGVWGGRRLVTPRGEQTRPTAERVRAALANALAATGGLDGACVLDLYAGTGAIGLELASRGAARVVLVERAPAALASIRANVRSLGATSVLVVAAEVAQYAASAGEAFDIVVADPPYDVPIGDVSAVMAALHTAGRLRPHADVIVEQSARGPEFVWPDPLVGVKAKRHGDTRVCYGRGP